MKSARNDGFRSGGDWKRGMACLVLFIHGCVHGLPFFGDFLEHAIIGHVALHQTAVDAHVVVQGGHGRQADRNRITAEGAAFKRQIGGAIDVRRSALGAFSLFHGFSSIGFPAG
ncbi:hypothetical protein DESC_770099 [Desulfosarcina cetonica]|nr:hypothetical protein DESC_770099 [Desulfosarcina cetonica]